MSLIDLLKGSDMPERLVRGETKPFTLVLDLLPDEFLSDDYDVIMMVKHTLFDANEEAVITKRLRGDNPELSLDSPAGPDPETGEGNVALVDGVFRTDDTSDLFSGFNREAQELHYLTEAGIIDPEGIYHRMITDTLIIENSVVHLPL